MVMGCMGEDIHLAGPLSSRNGLSEKVDMGFCSGGTIVVVWKAGSAAS
jgi:hypothetical protein